MARSKKKTAVLSPEDKLQQALVPVEKQPYKVPENWCWTKVGILSDLLRGVSYKKNDAHSEKLENDCLIMRGGNIGEGYIDINADNVYVDLGLVDENQLVKKNDIIIVASTGSTKVIGRAGVSNADYKDVSFGAFLMAVRPSQKSNPLYMDFYFQSDLYRNRIRNLASGVNINNIRTNYIMEQPFPLPPLPEQQRIVDRIESLFAKLDEAKEKAQAVVDGFEDRKAAILHKAFTGELTERWRRSHIQKDSTWINTTIDDLCCVFSGKGFKEKEYSDKGVKLLRISNVTYDALIWDDTKYLPNSYIESVPDLVLREGDLVIALNRPITNGKLKVSIVDENGPYILYQRVGCLRVRDAKKVDLNFLRYALLSKSFLNQVIKNLQGSDQPYINLPPLKKLALDICSIEEQKEIVSILNRILTNEKEAKEAAEQVIAQIDTMKKSILARAFRGELGTNDPNDESAVELLKAMVLC